VRLDTYGYLYKLRTFCELVFPKWNLCVTLYLSTIGFVSPLAISYYDFFFFCLYYIGGFSNILSVYLGVSYTVNDISITYIYIFKFLVMWDLEVPKISNSLEGVFGIYKKKKKTLEYLSKKFSLKKENDHSCVTW
jgi:hypothetical protein